MKLRENKQPTIATRRQFLSLMGLGALCYTNFDPIAMLARSLVDGLIADAQADARITPKRFVSVLYPGAPTRWVWDGFLNPNNETIVPTPAVANWLLEDTYKGYDSVAGAYPSNLVYRAEPVALPDGRVIYMPPLWNRMIPTSDGGSVPMRTLLGNALVMRGVDMQVDLGHGIGPAKALFPLGANASLTGLVGDASHTPLPVIGLSGAGNYADPRNQGYKSLQGTTPTLVTSSSDALSKTLSAFINSDAGTVANSPKLNSPAVQSVIANSLAELGSYAKSSMPGADVLYKNADSATRLFQTAFGDLKNVVYPSLLKKYTTLAQRCAHTAIPNIIPATGGGKYNFATGKFTSELAYQFAVAEYLLVNGFSSAISMCSEHSVGVAGIASSNDEHTEDDRQQSMICHSYQFLSLSAMLYELRSVLIAKGIWNDTLIHVTAEYNRNPRSDATGTDHAPNSNIVTMMSGAITKPIFIGNIKTDATPTGTYKGTYGVAAPVQTESGVRIITNNVAASTAAAILGVQNPLSQSSSIVSVDSSGAGITSLAEPPKNI